MTARRIYKLNYNGQNEFCLILGLFYAIEVNAMTNVNH